MIYASDIFKNAVASKSIPFGVLQLYGDSSYTRMMEIVYSLSTTVTPTLLMVMLNIVSRLAILKT